MPMSPLRKTSRSLSPTRSTIAWKSRLAEMPCWMLLMMASSFARCVISAVRSSTFSSSDLRPARVVEGDGGLAREHREEVAVGIVEATEHAVDVRVQHADDVVAHDQRRRRRTTAARSRGAAPARSRATRFASAPPRRAPRDVASEPRRVLALGTIERARRPALAADSSIEQHALRRRQLGGFFDQEVHELVGRAQLVHAQPRVDSRSNGSCRLDVSAR
jgi:hypothetical protein